MLRQWVKSGAAHALCWSGTGKWIGSLAGRRDLPVVLGYHNVVERLPDTTRTSIPAMLITRAMLERHLDWLGKRYQFVSLDELGDMLQTGASRTKPVAAVTFDDGYRDFYDHAFPLLRRKGVPAAVFVVTGLIGTGRKQVHDRLYLALAAAFLSHGRSPRDVARALGRLGIQAPEIPPHRLKHAAGKPFALTRALLDALPQAEVLRVVEELESELNLEQSMEAAPESLTWEMVAEIHGAGMTVASHTRTHAFLTNEKRQRVLDEVVQSRSELEKRLGTTVKHFAYPDGRFDDVTVPAVAEAGYRFAYTTCLHRDLSHPLLTIPRKVLWQNSCLDANGRFSPAIMSCQVNRTFDLIAGGCETRHSSALDGGAHTAKGSFQVTAP